MELFRVERNPWGMETVVGLSWDMLWVFAAAGLLFIIADALFRRRQPPMSEADLADPTGADARLAAVPERGWRHPLPISAVSLGDGRFHVWAVGYGVLAYLGRWSSPG